jgi:hypothetical protein
MQVCPLLCLSSAPLLGGVHHVNCLCGSSLINLTLNQCDVSKVGFGCTLVESGMQVDLVHAVEVGGGAELA